MFYFYFLGFLWFLRETRALLFWLYLWQLKEYHWGRFSDHFRTEKGKRIFWKPIFILKIFLVSFALFSFSSKVFLFWYFYASWIFILALIYFFESLKGLKEIFQRTLKRPVLTLKTLFLILIVIVLELLFFSFVFQKFYLFIPQNLYWLTFYLPLQRIYWFTFYLLVFDVFTSLIVTISVFVTHALSVIFFRNPLIKKAKKKRNSFKNLLVIGVTGSYGKTSTKDFLRQILSQKFKVLSTEKHQNSEVGISMSVLNNLKPEHEIFIVEMGAYNKGGIKLLCDITRPKIGLVTGVNEQHLATFGSMENLLSAEGGKELIESLPEDGLAFFNAKNEYCRELYEKTQIKKFLYGKNAELVGLENIEGAKIVAKELGMTDEEIKNGLSKVQNQLPGIQVKKNKDGLNIIDASYSANPDGVIAHLEYLKTFPGKRIIVMPCLIELGKASSEIHKKIGEKISEVCDLSIITTKERFKEIQEKAGNKAVFIENPKEIFKRIKNFFKPGDNLLIEGRVPKSLMRLLGI